MSEPTPQPSPRKRVQPMTNKNHVMEWRCILRGKRALNGRHHSIEQAGEVIFYPQAEAPGDDSNPTLYDVLRELIEKIEQNAAEMEYPSTILIGIAPRKKQTETP